MSAEAKTRRRLARLEETVSATCTVFRRIALETVETLLLLIGMYDFVHFVLSRQGFPEYLDFNIRRTFLTFQRRPQLITDCHKQSTGP
jgi:hypothetical protein